MHGDIPPLLHIPPLHVFNLVPSWSYMVHTVPAENYLDLACKFIMLLVVLVLCYRLRNFVCFRLYKRHKLVFITA